MAISIQENPWIPSLNISDFLKLNPTFRLERGSWILVLETVTFYTISMDIGMLAGLFSSPNI